MHICSSNENVRTHRYLYTLHTHRICHTHTHTLTHTHNGTRMLSFIIRKPRIYRYLTQAIKQNSLFNTSVVDFFSLNLILLYFIAIGSTALFIYEPHNISVLVDISFINYFCSICYSSIIG